MQQTDILIIGGGIAGTSTAYHLAKHGHDVTLLERGELAGEASGLNAGTIWAIGWSKTPNLASTLSMGGLDLFQTLQFDLGYDIEFRQSGSLKLIQTEGQYDFIRHEIQDLNVAGYNVSLLSSRETRGIEPALSSTVLGCMYYLHGTQANPVKTTRAFASLAQQRGARILIQHEVTGIELLDSGQYRVTTPQETFLATRLVLAAGPWCCSLGVLVGVDIPVFAVRGQMWSTGPVPYRIFHSVMAAESAHYWRTHPYSDEQTPMEMTHRGEQRLTRHLYGRQTMDGEIIFGGDRQVNAPKVPDPAGIEVNRQHAIELFPFLRDYPIKRTWAGWMPFTRQLKLMIGSIPQRDNLYVLAGLSSSGFEQGPMAGKLLADYIHDGSSSELLSAADPAQQVTLL
jgi:glycine/D-amino acid oxidase-like deaminating enzyme